jgi:hypothetical protein
VSCAHGNNRRMSRIANPNIHKKKIPVGASVHKVASVDLRDLVSKHIVGTARTHTHQSTSSWPGVRGQRHRRPSEARNATKATPAPPEEIDGRSGPTEPKARGTDKNDKMLAMAINRRSCTVSLFSSVLFAVLVFN